MILTGITPFGLPRSRPGYSAEALAFFSACSTAGTPVTDEYKVRYNNYIAYLKARGKWTISDSRYIWATGNEVWAKIDIRNPSRSVTLQNSYAGRFTANQGWNGNSISAGFGVLTNFNPGDGGVYNFTQNDASYHFLTLENDSVSAKQELSSATAGFNGGIIVQAYPGGKSCLNSSFTLTTSYSKYRPRNNGWMGMTRTGANTANVYMNGVNVETQTQASTALENKAIGVMGAYNGAWSAGNYTANSHAVFVAGSGSLDQATEINAFNYAFGSSYANSTYFPKRVIFEGDSRTGGNVALSNTHEYVNATMNTLGVGSGYGFAMVSAATERMDQITGQYATEIQPFRNTSLTKDIIVLWAGTNDIAAGNSANTLYNDIKTFCNAAKADGFKIIVVGEIDRNWTSYAAMDAVRASLRTSMLTDFPTSVSTNVYSGGAYADYYVDIYGETDFQSYLSANYQVDGIHPSTTGSDVVAGYVSTLIPLL